MDKSGIYEILCKHCGKVYVGLTKRSLNVRLKEHIAHLKFRHFEKSSVFQHMLEQCHHVDEIKLVIRLQGINSDS